MSELPESQEDGSRREEIALFRELLDVQREELSVRKEEIQVQREGQTNAHEYSMHSLNAQVVDRESSRTFHAGQLKRRLYFAGFAILILAAVVVAALWFKEPTIALEIIKVIGWLAAGGAGGYAIGYHRGRRRGDQEIQDAN